MTFDVPDAPAPDLWPFVEQAVADYHAKIDAACQDLLDQGQIPVILESPVEPGLFPRAEVITTHEYVRRYGPPPLPRRRPT